MPILTSKTFPSLAQCDALSKGALESHLKLYDGYIRKYNELAETLETFRAKGLPSFASDNESIKGDITFALGSVRNHELFFQNLGPESGELKDRDLLAILVKSFHSLPQFLIDLRQTAVSGRGWAFTAYDIELDQLFNYDAGGHNGLPVAGALPILTIDLFGHAYFYDYGTNRLSYIEAIMKCIDWESVAAKFAAAREMASAMRTSMVGVAG
jgi:Fe-Mn family superoxide dismutase